MRKRGFTLLEVIVVMALTTVIGGITLFVTMETYSRSALHTEKDSFIALLQRARMLSMNNICLGECEDGRPHGVHVTDGGYVLFQGVAYDPNDPLNTTFPAEPSLKRAGSLMERDVVFTALSGDSDCDPVCELSLQAPGGPTAIVSITGDGRILWTQ